ncbi:MAG TPA: hypothetical protein VFD94_05655 [Jatrophihabitans sp.]|nr:hypothetical protein [Jatrophihabitans sp.]
MTTSPVRIRRFGRLLGSILAVATITLFGAPAARADVTAAISALGSTNLYVDDAAGATLDRSAVTAVLNPSVKIAVLPADAGNPAALARQIGQALGGRVTVGVFVGHSFNAGSNLLCAGVAGSLASKAVADHRAQLQATQDLTDTIKDFANLVGNTSACGSSGGGSGSSGGSGASGGSSGSGGWIALGVLGVLGAAAVAGLVGWRRRRDRLALLDERAQVQPYYDRLAAEVSSLDAGGNQTARQALADAAERLTSAGSQLSGASRPAQLQAARRTTLEGLQAIRTARTALGLDPGPDLPPLAQTQAPQLTEPQQVQAGGQLVQGYPSYQPGAPYYFAGGGGYAGGWYSMPFWETLLIAEALSPGWGWGGGWGGYGSGYDSGFDAGRDSVQSSSGGDWGGGGGDWGGGGGGDWGGGGGGDSGGGSW